LSYPDPYFEDIAMPSGPFAHVCILVKDLDKAVNDWTKILGVLDPGQLKEPLVRYDTFSSGADVGMKWATFVSEHGAEIQFIQPGEGTPLGKRLEKLGEHVHHLCFTTHDVPGAMAKLKSEGIELASNGQMFNDPDMTWQRWAWVSPKSAHGVMLEVASPYESHHDGKWHPVPADETSAAS
jgi:methylmalonyl-CoA/ethylmalonyl-CoA epimerase